MKKILRFKYIFLILIMLVADVTADVTSKGGSTSNGLKTTQTRREPKSVRTRRQINTNQTEPAHDWLSNMLGGVTAFLANPAAEIVQASTGIVDSGVNIGYTIKGWNDGDEMLDKLGDVRQTLENGLDGLEESIWEGRFDGLEKAVNDLGDSLGNRLQNLGKDRQMFHALWYTIDVSGELEIVFLESLT